MGRRGTAAVVERKGEPAPSPPLAFILLRLRTAGRTEVDRGGAVRTGAPAP